MLFLSKLDLSNADDLRSICLIVSRIYRQLKYENLGLNLIIAKFFHQLVQDGKEVGSNLESLLFNSFDFNEIKEVTPDQLQIFIRGICKAGSVR